MWIDHSFPLSLSLPLPPSPSPSLSLSLPLTRTLTSPHGDDGRKDCEEGGGSGAAAGRDSPSEEVYRHSHQTLREESSSSLLTFHPHLSFPFEIALFHSLTRTRTHSLFLRLILMMVGLTPLSQLAPPTSSCPTTGLSQLRRTEILESLDDLYHWSDARTSNEDSTPKDPVSFKLFAPPIFRKRKGPSPEVRNLCPSHRSKLFFSTIL